jgi:hypothetical protein
MSTSTVQASSYILPAECVGVAEITDGVIDVGGVKIEIGREWLATKPTSLPVYIRRLVVEQESEGSIRNGSVFDIALSFGDGLAEEEFYEEERKDEIAAAQHPGGRKEYFREKWVGTDTQPGVMFYGADHHPMTNEEFEKEWHEADDDADDVADFDPYALAGGSEADRARLREFYRAAWVGEPDATGKIRTDEDFEETWPVIEEHLARMGRAAEAKSNVAEVIAPAGAYFLGDPCYAVPDGIMSADEQAGAWEVLLDSTNFFERPDGQLADGARVIAFSTAYGDGLFWDDEGNQYPVDAGLIGLVGVTDATTAALAETEERHGESVMTRVQFAEPVLCSREGRGVLTFGQYQIETA